MIQSDINGNFIKEYAGANIAEKEMHSPKNSSIISKICRTGKGTYKGCKWEYKNTNEDTLWAIH